jgi:hypothetical protein
LQNTQLPAIPFLHPSVCRHIWVIPYWRRIAVALESLGVADLADLFALFMRTLGSIVIFIDD